MSRSFLPARLPAVANIATGDGTLRVLSKTALRLPDSDYRAVLVRMRLP